MNCVPKDLARKGTQPPEQGTSAAGSSSMPGYGTGHDALHAYYKNHFPHDDLCTLLAREWRGKNLLEKREMCIENVDSVYIRWMSVCDATGLRKLFADKRVEKFHTGAIFNNPPYFKKKGVAMEPMQREFVVDIDVNDYVPWGVDPDDIESCDSAWPIVAFGMHMVKHVLRHHFGFENMLLVYSGRRGAHMSVYDERACCLSDEARAAIVSYLQPSDKTGKSGRLPYGRILQSAGFTELFDSHIKPFWVNFCLKPREEGGMGVLDGPFDKESFMDLFGSDHAKSRISVSAESGVKLWEELTRFADSSQHSESTWLALKETVMCYVWPRLDAAVSKHRNHLSKSVFSIHPKTKRICVPIPGDSYDFNPSECPTYTDLVACKASAMASFNLATKTLSKFVKRMQSSTTEQWVMPRLAGPQSSAFSMVSRKRARDDPGVHKGDNLENQYCFPDRTRFAADTVRVFCALASDADPTRVSIYFYTSLREGCVNAVLPGYAPPFRAPGEFPMNSFVDAVIEASRNPGNEIVCDRAYTCVLFHPRQTNMQWCEIRMQRIAERLSDGNELCTVNAKWDRSAIATMIKDMASESWNTKYIHMS